MCSRYLSVGSFRFLVHPSTPGELGFPYGQLTALVEEQTPLVVTVFRTVELQLVRVLSLRRGLGVPAWSS